MPKIPRPFASRTWRSGSSSCGGSHAEVVPNLQAERECGTLNCDALRCVEQLASEASSFAVSTSTHSGIEILSENHNMMPEGVVSLYVKFSLMPVVASWR